MNDEIKEILWVIKSCKQDYDKQKDGMHTFDYGELYLLYNYITNIQERCSYLERSNDRREDTILGLRQELDDVEQQRDKAINLYKNTIINCDGTAEDLLVDMVNILENRGDSQ